MRVLQARRAVLPDGDGGLQVVPARVTVDGARIVAVVPSPADPPPPGADDLGDLLLTPAFVDAHTHLALVGLRGGAVGAATGGNVVEDLFFEVERRMTRDDVRALTAVGAMEALLGGTATVWDHFYFADGVLQGLDDVGLAGVVAPALQDLAGPGVPQLDDALALTARLAGDEGLAARGSGACLGPHATDTVSDALWRTVADLAERLALPVHVHLAQSLDEVRRAHAVGTTPLGRLRRTGVLDAGPGWSLVHGLFLADDELASLGPRHTLVACPSAAALFGFPPPVDRWEAAGRSWAVGTDAPASNDGASVRAELRVLASIRAGDVVGDPAYEDFRGTGGVEGASAVWAARQRRWTARAAFGDPVALLHRVWTIPGRLHPRLRCGEIAPGALAHLALWDTDHPSMWPGDDPLRALALGVCGGALQQVMVAGSWRGERGALQASLLAEPGWRAVRDEAAGRRRALLRAATS